MSARALTCALIGLLLWPAQTARAQSNVGTALGAFLKIETSARSTGMGNTGVGLSDGIESVYFNPAAIGSINRFSVQFTHLFWLADIDLDYAAVAFPVRGIGTFFGSVTSLSSGKIDVRTVDQPLGTGERYDVSNIAISLGFGRRVSSRFIVGGQINSVQERIWNSSYNAVTISVGTVYWVTAGGIKLGAGLCNLSTQASFSGRDLAIQYDADPEAHGGNSTLPADQFTGDFPLPLQFRIGLQVPHEFSPRNRVMLLVDAVNPSDNTQSMSAGGEWILAGVLALRAGYQTLFQEDTELGWTLGFGLRHDGRSTAMRLDYAWAEHENLSETHSVTVALEF
jgi:hypothetical protein